MPKSEAFRDWQTVYDAGSTDRAAASVSDRTAGAIIVAAKTLANAIIYAALIMREGSEKP